MYDIGKKELNEIIKDMFDAIGGTETKVPGVAENKMGIMIIVTKDEGGAVTVGTQHVGDTMSLAIVTERTAKLLKEKVMNDPITMLRALVEGAGLNYETAPPEMRRKIEEHAKECPECDKREECPHPSAKLYRSQRGEGQGTSEMPDAMKGFHLPGNGTSH